MTPTRCRFAFKFLGSSYYFVDYMLMEVGFKFGPNDEDFCGLAMAQRDPQGEQQMAAQHDSVFHN